MNGSNPEFRISTPINDHNEGVFICPMVLALAFVFLADKLQIPNQLMAMLYGTVIGVGYAFVPYLQNLQSHFWNPDAILLVCHPIMIVKVAYTLDIYVFVRSVKQILILASVGTGMFIFTFGFLIIVMTNRGVTLVNIVAAGTTLAAIDVPEILMELNRIKNLEIIMDGESIFGSALCFMTFTFCQGIYELVITKWYHVVCLYARFVVLAYIIGASVGRVAACLFRFLYHDYYNVILTVVATTYLAYYICEQFIGCSATICTFMIGYIIAKERHKLSPTVDIKVQTFLDNAYNAVELLNCIILSAYVTYRMVKIYKGFDVAVAIGVYILGNVLRILILLSLSPILCRMGMGFNFTTLFTIFWAAKRGSLQLLQVIFIAHLNMTNVLGTELLCFTLSYLTLSFIVNMTSLRHILNYFGLIQFTVSRKSNITMCISMLLQQKNRVLFALKTNRLYSDLNWTLINKATSINNPYANPNSNQDRISAEFETHCPLCFKAIPYLSSEDQMQELTRYVRAKMLKRQRISLVRQHELALLGKTELEIMMQCIEDARNSTSLNVPITFITDLFKTEKTTRFLKEKLEKFKINDVTLEHRKHCLRLSLIRNQWYTCIGMFIVIANIGLITIWIISDVYKWQCARLILWTGYGTSTCFLFDMIVFWISYTNRTLKALYAKYYWEILNSFFLLLDITSFAASITFDFHMIRPACLIRILTLYKLLEAISPHIVKYLDHKIDKNLYSAYCLGLAMVTSLEEVQANLSTICKHRDVREMLGLQLQADKMLIIESLALVQHHRPTVCVTLGTQQIKSAIMKIMATAVLEIKATGLLEYYEYCQIRKIIENANKTTTLTSISIGSNSAKSFVSEIAWMGSDPELLAFIYGNIMMRIWEPGDIICEDGQFLDGVILITEGLIKITYLPNEAILENLHKKGELPIRELLMSPHLEEALEDYLFMGSTIGELSFLTQRPFNCKCQVIRSTCGLVISNSVLQKAMNLNSDPVYGLRCRIWKHVSNPMLYRMLMERSHYQTVPVSTLQELMNRAFIPNISNYKILHVSNIVDDIFLLDGMLVDNNSKEIYTAPCYLPRSIHQIFLPKEYEDSNICTKIIVIPSPSINAYKVMEVIEDASELIQYPDRTAIIRNVDERKNIRVQVIEETILRERETYLKNKSISFSQERLTISKKKMRKSIASGESSNS